MRIKIFLLFIIAAAEAFAQDSLLQCLDPDIVTAFLGQGRFISREVPDEYAELSMSNAFVFIGSAVGEQDSSVAYKTGLDASAAEPEIVAALEALGWKRVVEPRRRTARRGFQITHKQPIALSFCRANKYLNSNFREGVEGTFVVLSSMGSGSCAVTQAMAGRRASDFLPWLDLPPSIRTSSGGGSVGSGDSASARIRFKWTKELEELMSFFHRQLADQGWKDTTQWSTPRAAGSVWESNPEEGLHTSGTLEIVRNEKSSETSVVFCLNMFEAR